MNRQKLKNTFYYLTKPLPFKTLMNFSNENFIFPFYHLVADSVPPHIKHLYSVVSRKQFLNDLEFLLKHFSPATFDNVLAFIKNKKRSSKPLFFFSFDDGMRECYDNVYPILKQKGLQAAFFINPAFVDNKELFFKHKISLVIEEISNSSKSALVKEVSNVLNESTVDQRDLVQKISKLELKDIHTIARISEIYSIDFNQYLEEHQPYMTLEQIRELNNEGFIIGSHSYDHPEFRKIDEQQMRHQIKISLDYIKEKINPGLLSFAFPFTDFEIPALFFDYLYNEANLDVSFGTAGIKKDSAIKHIQRIPMEEKRKNAERIIREEYTYFWAKSFFGKNMIERK